MRAPRRPKRWTRDAIWPIKIEELAGLEHRRRDLAARNRELRRLGAYRHPNAYGWEIRRLVRSLLGRHGPERTDRLASYIVTRDETEAAILTEALNGPDLSLEKDSDARQ